MPDLVPLESLLISTGLAMQGRNLFPAFDNGSCVFHLLNFFGDYSLIPIQFMKTGTLSWVGLQFEDIKRVN